MRHDHELPSIALRGGVKMTPGTRALLRGCCDCRRPAHIDQSRFRESEECYGSEDCEVQLVYGDRTVLSPDESTGIGHDKVSHLCHPSSAWGLDLKSPSRSISRVRSRLFPALCL